MKFSETDVLIWKVLDILSNAETQSPVFTYRGVKFRMILELKFHKNIRNDSLEMYIDGTNCRNGTNCGNGTNCREFRDFEINTCIKTLHGDKYVANATISNSVLVSRKKVWSAERLSLLIDYKNLLGHDSPNIVKFFCTFDQKSESDDKTGLLHNGSKKNPNDERLDIETDEFDYLTRVSSDFRKISEASIEADMTLKCGDQSFSAQKAILLARCEKFAQECSNNSINRTIKITNMEPSILGQFLEYVYTGTSTNLTEEIALKLYDVGSRCEVKHLPYLCSEFMGEKLSDRNALKLLFLSDKHNDEAFKKKIIGFLIKNHRILRSTDWSRVSEDNPLLALEVFQLAHKMLSQ